jgi:hypothetical protein
LIYIGIPNGIKPKEFLNSLGGIYFIEGESKYEEEDHYKTCDIYNKDKTLFDIVYNVAIATLEDALHYRLFIINPESKNFETKIQSRKNYGEFFKMKKDNILHLLTFKMSI